MMVNVPMAAPQPMVMATAVATAAAPPLVMAQPMGGEVMAQPPVLMGQPMTMAPQPMVMAQPMTAPPVMNSGLPWRQSLQLDKKSKLTELKDSGQSPIPGITPSDWAEIIAAIDETQRSSFFYDCPTCECVYFCVPGACAQSALCMCNPITWIFCICPMEAKKSAAKSKIEPIVSKYGLKFRFIDGFDLTAVIEQ